VNFDVKGVIAILVVIFSFVLVGGSMYVDVGHTPDPSAVAIAGTALGAVLGFYFGHANGAAAALTQNAASLNASAAQLNSQATQILSLAQQRRSSDTSGAVVAVSGPPLGNPG
jgi:hypothetical protein